MNFFTLIFLELKKIHRSKIILLLLIPVLIMWFPAILNADSHFHMKDIGITPENSFLIQGFMGMSWFMIPAALTICTVLLHQIEQSGKGILKMLALPISIKQLCLAKFVVLILLSFIQMLMSIGVYFIAAAIASKAQAYPFILQFSYVFKVSGKLYLAAIPMAAVFWALAVLIQTPVFSIGICLASLVPSVLLINTKIWFLYPMCYPFYILMTEYGKVSENIFTTSVELIPWIPAAIVITIIGLVLSCTFFGYNERK